MKRMAPLCPLGRPGDPFARLFVCLGLSYPTFVSTFVSADHSIIAHYRGENGRKFVVTNKQREKIDGFEQKSCTKCRRTSDSLGSKSKPRSATPTTDRRRARTRSRTYERQKRAPSAHARTIVRREHQAHCAHPAVGITSTEPGGLARPRKPICKLKRFVTDLERTTDILYIWSALIAVTIITPGTARTSASSAT